MQTRIDLWKPAMIELGRSGRLAIRSLALKEGRVERLSIRELEVDRLRVRELVVEEERKGS